MLLPLTSGVDVAARAQRQLFAGQSGVAAAQEGGQALLRALGAAAVAPGLGEGDGPYGPASSAPRPPAPKPTRVTSALRRVTVGTAGSAVAS